MHEVAAERALDGLWMDVLLVVAVSVGCMTSSGRVGKHECSVVLERGFVLPLLLSGPGWPGAVSMTLRAVSTDVGIALSSARMLGTAAEPLHCIYVRAVRTAVGEAASRKLVVCCGVVFSGGINVGVVVRSILPHGRLAWLAKTATLQQCLLSEHVGSRCAWLRRGDAF